MKSQGRQWGGLPYRKVCQGWRDLRPPCPTSPTGLMPLSPNMTLDQMIEARTPLRFYGAPPIVDRASVYTDMVQGHNMPATGLWTYKPRLPCTLAEQLELYESQGYHGAEAHSDWPREVFANPNEHRPPLADDFFVDELLVLATANLFTTVAQFQTPEDYEGVMLQIAGEDTSVNTNARWRLLINGRQPAGYNEFHATFALITQPRRLVLFFPRASLIELQILIPTQPRTIRAYMRGWVAPMTGGGAVHSGYASY